MEELRIQLDKTRSDLVVACARLRGTEMLARNVEELRQENDLLREQLQRYEDALLSVENRLESFASLHGAESVPMIEVQRPVAVSSLLEENQRLSSIIELLQRERMTGQDGRFMNTGEERATLEEKIEELQSENDILRDEVELARSMAQNRGNESSMDVDAVSLGERLERSERTAMTKSRLVELLTSEVQRLDLELRATREELTVSRANSSSNLSAANQCVGDGCQHQREVEQLNQRLADLNRNFENVNQRHQEESRSFAQRREELEQQVMEQQNHMQATFDTTVQEIKERSAHEKKDTEAKLHHSQTIVARLNEENQQLRQKSNNANVHLRQTQLRLQQMESDRDRQKEFGIDMEKKYQAVFAKQATYVDEITDLRRQISALRDQLQRSTGNCGPIGRNVRGPTSYPSEITARGPGHPIAVRDGPEPEPVRPIKFVRPDNSRPAPQPMQPQPMQPQPGVERECPVCRQRFRMELVAFYNHCDQCADAQDFQG